MLTLTMIQFKTEIVSVDKHFRTKVFFDENNCRVRRQLQTAVKYKVKWVRSRCVQNVITSVWVWLCVAIPGPLPLRWTWRRDDRPTRGRDESEIDRRLRPGRFDALVDVSENGYGYKELFERMCNNSWLKMSNHWYFSFALGILQTTLILTQSQFWIIRPKSFAR